MLRTWMLFTCILIHPIVGQSSNLQILQVQLEELGFPEISQQIDSLSWEHKVEINQYLEGPLDWFMEVIDPAKAGKDLPNINLMKHNWREKAEYEAKRMHDADRTDSAQRKPFDEIKTGYGNEDVLLVVDQVLT